MRLAGQWERSRIDAGNRVEAEVGVGHSLVGVRGRRCGCLSPDFGKKKTAEPGTEGLTDEA